MIKAAADDATPVPVVGFDVIAEPLPEEPDIIIAHAGEDFTADDNVLHVTSHALAMPVNVVPEDDDSVIDNSDGLNVLSDPRTGPPPAASRKPDDSKAPGSAIYPLSTSTSLLPCSACVPSPDQYVVSASDIPTNSQLPFTNCFRRIFKCCCWRESTKPLQFFCKTMSIAHLIDQRKMIFLAKN